MKFYIEQKPFETTKSMLTVTEILAIVNEKPERYTLALKQKNGYHEYEGHESITIDRALHFVLLDKRPTYNA